MIERTDHALRCGALVPIVTEIGYLEQCGIGFIVRLAHLERKEQGAQESPSRDETFDPFLPYDEALFVAHLSDTHVCLLNKFNVFDHHVLIVTRAFEEQEALLNLQDFDALWPCMAEIDGLAFYNAGRVAGASQRHKHLQFVPLPLGPRTPPVPIEPLLGHACFDRDWGVVPAVGFKHALAPMDETSLKSRATAAETLLATYRSLLEAAGITARKDDRQSSPYNLLVTRRWMLLVPRSQECFDSISINALGFAGALLVRSNAQMERLRQCGPCAVLKTVAVPSA